MLFGTLEPFFLVAALGLLPRSLQLENLVSSARHRRLRSLHNWIPTPGFMRFTLKLLQEPPRQEGVGLNRLSLHSQRSFGGQFGRMISTLW